MKARIFITLGICLCLFACGGGTNKDKDIEETISIETQEQEALAPGAKICWAQVVYVNKKNTCKDCSNLLNTWWKKTCNGNTCPWDPNKGYGIVCEDNIGACGVQMGNIQSCVPAGTPSPKTNDDD